MKNLLLIIFLLSFSARSQKETIQNIDAGNIKSIVLSSDEVYKISVKTVPGNLITIKSKADGEYFNNISLDTKVRNDVIYIESRFKETLRSGFDKLSAHKVFAMEVVLQIPSGMDVEILSNVASVFMEGFYHEVLIQLNSGSAYLENFKGDTVINTFMGNIEVEAENAAVEAESRHGKIDVRTSYNGDYRLKLTSINGNIKVRETK